jgi:hypothetical protein
MVDRRRVIMTASLLGVFGLLEMPAEGGIGDFFRRMLAVISKTFPPILFARYLGHSQWRQPIEDVYSQLLTLYSPDKTVQTTGAAHNNFIAQSAFHLSAAPADMPPNVAFYTPGSAAFLNVVNSEPKIAAISGLNYTAVDRAGQLYTEKAGCDCAASYMLPVGGPREKSLVNYSNGYVGARVKYPSARGVVELQQVPYANFNLLADGSAQFDVAHVVTVSDDTGRVLFRTDPSSNDRSQRPLTYSQVIRS